MGVAERPGDLAHDGQRLLGWQAFAADALLQRAAVDVLHRHVVAAAIVADVVDRDDVRMLQLRERFALAQEALAELFVDREGRCHDLQRDTPVQRALGGEIDGGHRAGAELALDVIARNFDVHPVCCPPACTGPQICGEAGLSVP